MTSLNPDSPTLNNKINWQSAQARLVARIASCTPPHVLGVHGDWGSGKTSFMRQIQWQLGGEPNDAAAVQLPLHQTGNRSKPERPPATHQKNVITIWFDAWRYQNEPSPVVALLQEMRQQLTGIPALRERVRKIGYVAVSSALDSIGQVGKAISLDVLPDTEKIQKRGEQWEQGQLAQSLSTDTIRTLLQQAIHNLLPNKAARVVVFIDDLDRCTPKAAMRLLEGLKIYLSLPQCVFVLGMNEGMLTEAILEEFSNLKGASQAELKLRASHYLEKICTDIYRLPHPDSCSRLMLEWLLENTTYNDKVHSSAKREIAALEMVLKEVDCLPPNPRRIKALANQWPRFARCVPLPADNPALSAEDNAVESAVWAVRVLLVSYIHQFNRDLWERWQHHGEFWTEIVEWCNDPYNYADLYKDQSDHWSHALGAPHNTGGQVTAGKLRRANGIFTTPVIKNCSGLPIWL